MAKRSKRILSWAPNWSRRKGGGRWKKQVEGKVYFFGPARSRDDARAYREAERRYLEFMQDREATKPVEVSVSEATVIDICEKFLQHQEGRYRRGEIGADYFEKLRCNLLSFADFVGPDIRFSAVNELLLEDYRNRTLDLPRSEKTGRRISLRYARDRLGSVRTLYRWAYKLYLCERLPRNLLDYTRVSVPTPEVRIFTMEELRRLLEASPARLRCWIALALNAGMGQQDISDLRCDEIDGRDGFVERERSKTGVKAKHRLWQITLDLLAEHKRPGAAGTDRVFLTAGGHPLVRREIADGRYKMSDAVKSSFWRVQVRTGINDGRGFYVLRKTGATLIETIDPAVTEMYLSHVEPGMKRAYALRDWARLERALIEMEDRLPLRL